MRNNINYKETMGNKATYFCTENIAAEEVTRALRQLVETFFKEDRSRKIKQRAKKTILPAKNDINDEFAETIKNIIKQSFAEDRRRKINWKAREKRGEVFYLKNPLARM